MMEWVQVSDGGSLIMSVYSCEVLRMASQLGGSEAYFRNKPVSRFHAVLKNVFAPFLLGFVSIELRLQGIKKTENTFC